MKLWTDFADYHLSNLPGCTFFAAQNALREAAQEFCERSKVWRVTMDTVTTTANTTVYDFDFTSEFELSKLMSARLDGQPLPPLLPDQVDIVGMRGILVLNPREYTLVPIQAAGLPLIMKVALQPANTSRGVEDWIYAMFAKQIAAGAKAKLMSEEGKPYTNPKGAAENQLVFDQGIGSAVVRAAKGYSSAPLRSTGSFF